jgi:site-specific DNA-methyltransferase (adenine-specific)
MNPYYDKDSITLYCGDLLDVLPQLTEKIDHVVTDPPYGLSFMGRGWDHAVPGPEYWKIISDACKPGALMMAFGGTRTYHRLTCAIEDAGWDIRDCLMWLYGSGFPKAMDIGKMVDKAARGVPQGSSDPTSPNHGKYKTQATEGDRGQNFGAGPGQFMLEQGVKDQRDLVEIAKPWQGYANALKPAYEPIVLAMKAMDGTIAHNALTHGVAGMNIDASRIACDGGSPAAQRRATAKATGHSPMQDSVLGVQTANEAEAMGKIGRRGSAEVYAAERPAESSGRWPANIILEHHPDCKQIGTTVIKGDHRSDCNGTRPSGFANVGAESGDSVPNARVYGNEEVPVYECHPDCPIGMLGDKARFLYCAKASKKERGTGNNHPTVKPLEVMRYLLTLLSTPTGGVILDPFAGSGTTLLAAKALGRRCIGVELEPSYCDIIVSRLEAQ